MYIRFCLHLLGIKRYGRLRIKRIPFLQTLGDKRPQFLPGTSFQHRTGMFAQLQTLRQLLD